jgi:lipoprotein-releasing system permease protein
MYKNNSALFIARRYFAAQRNKRANSAFVSLILLLIGSIPMLFGKKNALYQRAQHALVDQNFIKLLTNISMIGVGVGTAALIIILSVFNGLEELTKGLYSTYNAEIKVTPSKGKSFIPIDEVVAQIEAIASVKAVTKVVEDDAFLRYGNAEMMVVLKGVSDNFVDQYDLGKALYQGTLDLHENSQGYPLALLGLGVQQQLSVQLNDRTQAMVFYYPRKGRRIVLDPDRALLRKSILPGGILAIEQQFDAKYVIVPIEFARELLQYEEEVTSLEIKVDRPRNIPAVQQQIRALVSQEFEVLNAEEQQASILKAVKIERLFVFITFIFILAIASFNVFFSLAMLAIEKKKDIAILLSMGASKGFVRKIFLYEGVLIALSGAALGLCFGFLVVLLQQQFGIVPLGVPSSIVDAYPVKLKPLDFVYTGLVVVFITLSASYVPAMNAARTRINDHV